MAGNIAAKSIEQDIKQLLERLQQDRYTNAFELHIPDEYIIAMGGNPEDYPELMPGIRTVRTK